MNIFFQDFDTSKWFLEEEEHFRLDRVTYDPELFVHKINTVA